jgi:hypothetical protein
MRLLNDGQTLLLDFVEQADVGTLSSRKNDKQPLIFHGDPSVHLRAIQLRQHDIQNRQVDPIAGFPEFVQSLLPIRCQNDASPAPPIKFVIAQTVASPSAGPIGVFQSVKPPENSNDLIG